MRGVAMEADFARDHRRRTRRIEDGVIPLRERHVVAELVEDVHTTVALERVPACRAVAAVLADEPRPTGRNRVRLATELHGQPLLRGDTALARSGADIGVAAARRTGDEHGAEEDCGEM